MFSLRLSTIIAGFILAVPLWVHAEVLVIDAVSQSPANAENGLLRPTNGMRSAQVEKQFGTPKEKVPAVGYPPISRWVYDGFTVYFEHDLVLHSVVHRNTAE